MFGYSWQAKKKKKKILVPAVFSADAAVLAAFQLQFGRISAAVLAVLSAAVLAIFLAAV